MIDLSALKNESGIYLLRNLINGKIYIGGTIDIRVRVSRHIAELNRDNHHNPHLRSAWKKYGSRAWEIEILESIEGSDVDIIRESEQIWLDSLQPYEPIGYNINKSAAMPSSTTKDKMRLAQQGRKITEEALIKRRATLKKKCPVKIGDRYHRLLVVEETNSRWNGCRVWLCKCDCGAERIVRQASLRNGNTKSCGCLSIEECVKTGRSNRKHGKYAKEK